jgi:hypothetical protein
MRLFYFLKVKQRISIRGVLRLEKGQVVSLPDTVIFGIT